MKVKLYEIEIDNLTEVLGMEMQHSKLYIYIYTAWLGMLLEMFYGRKESAGGVSKGSITG